MKTSKRIENFLLLHVGFHTILTSWMLSSFSRKLKCSFDASHFVKAIECENCTFYPKFWTFKQSFLYIKSIKLITIWEDGRFAHDFLGYVTITISDILLADKQTIFGQGYILHEQSEIPKFSSTRILKHLSTYFLVKEYIRSWRIIIEMLTSCYPTTQQCFCNRSWKLLVRITLLTFSSCQTGKVMDCTICIGQDFKRWVPCLFVHADAALLISCTSSMALTDFSTQTISLVGVPGSRS